MEDKNKWYLALSVSIILIGICILGIINSSGSQDGEGALLALRPTRPAMKSNEIRKRLEEARNFVPPDPVQEVKDVIASHKARMEADPDDPESPVLLEAMGNLYLLKLNDYDMAAYCYEQLLLRYPDYNKARAYIGLVTALERMNDEEGVNRVCREIRKEFPPDSVEYQWAAEKTGMRISKEVETAPLSTDKNDTDKTASRATSAENPEN